MALDKPHLGYTTEAELSRPYAPFFNTTLPPLTPQAIEALQRGPRPHTLFETPTTIARLLQDGYRPLETGYALTPGGGMIVSCLHNMPGVTPAMWDWWFRWHGSESARYKLWHPLAHVSCEWTDGKGYTGEYAGRVSKVSEYVGGKIDNISIPFVRPSELGLDEEALKKRGEVAICVKGLRARELPVQVGCMVHHVRPTEDGCEMRSRFWIAGEFVTPIGGPLGAIIVRGLARLQALGKGDAEELLVHNAEEMAHLAAFLPQLYAQFKDDGS